MITRDKTTEKMMEKTMEKKRRKNRWTMMTYFARNAN